MVKHESSLSSIYGALADSTRRRILHDLRTGERTVSELRSPHDMTLAAMGKHVAVLEAAGLIRTTKRGRVRSCALVPGALSAAQSWIDEQSRFWNERLDSLVSHLEGEA
ncbi:helix-turn-helix transcriptional regulator [Humibacter sp. RRB41]|uniref:ArsR/SmtB family transcription factor n=1 Tax=Humibacter sp. RRB41 TaxID=2919946 RepID=UPI001FAA3A86|nr:metalloregulator ArsR/SmtB family transcription factor [Humibacter sp. RRB41]